MIGPQINLEQFRRGLEVILEHGADDPEINVTGDPTLAEKSAWAALKDMCDDYVRLYQM